MADGPQRKDVTSRGVNRKQAAADSEHSSARQEGRRVGADSSAESEAEREAVVRAPGRTRSCGAPWWLNSMEV
jgi:hypothetical protein